MGGEGVFEILTANCDGPLNAPVKALSGDDSEDDSEDDDGDGERGE